MPRIHVINSAPTTSHAGVAAMRSRATTHDRRLRWVRLGVLYVGPLPDRRHIEPEIPQTDFVDLHPHEVVRDQPFVATVVTGAEAGGEAGQQLCPHEIQALVRA
jgi:hypothetical protein